MIIPEEFPNRKADGFFRFTNTFASLICNTNENFCIVQKKTKIAHGDKKFSGLLPFHFYVLEKAAKGEAH